MYENVKTVDDGGVLSFFTGFMKGIVFALLFTVVVFLISAILLSYTSLPEDAIPVISTAVKLIGACISGFVPAKRSGNRGIITGAVSGLLYILIIILTAALTTQEQFFGMSVLTTALLCVLSGALGGIFGVNLRPKQTQKKR